MTESNVCCVSLPFQSQPKFDFLRNSLDLNEPIQNSAPSRLENFDDLYLSEFILPSSMKATGAKTNSLNSLISNSERTLARLHSCGSPSFSISSSDVPDSPDLSSSPISEQKQMFLPFLTPTDAINIELRDFESVQPSFCQFTMMTPPPPITFDCTKTYTPDKTESKCQKMNDFNTINLKALELKDDQATTVNEKKDKAAQNQPTTNDHKNTDGKVDSRQKSNYFFKASSLFSDQIFNRDTEDREEEIPSKQMVYRSLSDSLVHRRHRKSVDQPLKRRKSVHFADTSGYELEIHIPIRQSDDYKVPPRLKEALEKIRARTRGKDDDGLFKRDRCGFNTFLRHFSLILNFQQPFLDPTFQRRVKQQNVCLESVSVLPNSMSFTGVVRVVNLEFEKLVTIRYSTDRWKSHTDIPACYVATLSGADQDQFSFHVVASDDAINCGNIEIAVQYKLPKSKRDFWDNNYRHNYVISCLKLGGNGIDDGMMK